MTQTYMSNYGIFIPTILANFVGFFLPDGSSFALLLLTPSQPRGQLMRPKEGISYPLKGFALILQVSIWFLQLLSRTE